MRKPSKETQNTVHMLQSSAGGRGKGGGRHTDHRSPQVTGRYEVLDDHGVAVGTPGKVRSPWLGECGLEV